MNKVDLKTNKKNVELGYLRDSYCMLSHFATYKAKGDTSSSPKSKKSSLPNIQLGREGQ